MDQFLDFLIKNFFLLCLVLGVIFMVLRNYGTRIKALYPILVVCSALLLSVLYFIEDVTHTHTELAFVSTLCCVLGFIIRPVVLFFFLKLTISNRLVLRIALILIGVNALVYLFPLFMFSPALSHLVIYYENTNAIRGPLFYTCHIILSAIMIYFIIYSLMGLRGRHKYDALACLICVAFIGFAVLIESFLVAQYLLNTTIAISCLFYIVHLYQQASIKDALTGLYDRKAYYNDLSKIKGKVTGIIVIDMNGLKAINDNYGHKAGDLALVTIAEAIYNSIDLRTMDAYRMGGDEFVILSTSQKEDILESTIKKIREKLKDTEYYLAIGYAKREGEMRIHDLTLIADEMMYKDKSDYYKSHKIERRRVN